MSELSAQSTENARNLEKEAADMEAFILQSCSHCFNYLAMA